MMRFSGTQKISWIERTNQAWKIWIFIIFIFLGAISFLCMVMSINGIQIPNRNGEIEFATSFILLTFGALTWLILSLRCPKCAHKPVWPILKSAQVNEWLRVIAALECCPKCGE